MLQLYHEGMNNKNLPRDALIISVEQTQQSMMTLSADIHCHNKYRLTTDYITRVATVNIQH